MTDTPDPKPPLIVGSSGDGLVTTDDIVDRIREEKPSVENPPKAAMCEHYWASHVLGGFPIAVRTCQLCRAVDWDDLKRELEVAFGKGSVVRAKRAKSMLRYIKANLADLPGWQEAWFTEAMQVYGGETYQATYTASSSAYQRGMRLAHGHDVPPLPVPTLPTRVDDLDSDTYDALRSRYAWLEQRHRDTAHSELAAINVRQAMEIGDRGEALDRVRQLHRREPLYVLDCDCPRPDEDTDAYDDYEDSHTVTADGDTVCLKQPRGAECGHCRNSDGDHVLWPCPTVRALDETPPDAPLTCGDCGHPVTHANCRCGTCGCPNGSVDLTITPTSTALDGDAPKETT